MSYVSRKMRQSARGETCTLRLPGCNHDPETTVLCHLRMFGWAGMGQKPHDFLAVYACSDCHDKLDRRGSRADGFTHEDVLRALGETLSRMHEKGIFP